MTSRGCFISIDGIDGCGKSEQVRRLAAWLGGRGLPVVTCRDPGHTAIGEQIRRILLDCHHRDMSPQAELFLYMASRSQLVHEVIRPALEAGRIVVCDRFLLANVVYQGHACGLGAELVWQIGRVAVGDTWPDLTLVLDVDPRVAAGRLKAVRDRIEQRGLEFQQRVRQGFLDEAARQPDRIRVIASDGPIEAVEAAVRQEVERVVRVVEGS